MFLNIRNELVVQEVTVWGVMFNELSVCCVNVLKEMTDVRDGFKECIGFNREEVVLH